jgi:23S rRNA (guanine1835-N2)-methyltransferase
MSETSAHIELELEAPQGNFLLRRHGHPKEQLRAWDNADIYLLEEIAQLVETKKPKHVLIVNDGFGALSIALKAYAPHVIIDSAHSRRALRANLSANHNSVDEVATSTSFQMKWDSPHETYDLVVMKLPKSNAQLDDQLRRIKHFVGTETTFIAGAMAKRIQKSTVDSFQRHFEDARCSLAHKRARLIRVSPPGKPDSGEPVALLSYIVAADLARAPHDLELNSMPGTFAHGKLDLGARALLEVLNLPSQVDTMLDYGCGTGVLGIVAGLRHTEAQMTFVDDAAAAMVSTRLNVAQHFDSERALRTTLLEQDSLADVVSNSQSVVLNNPPFHDAGTRTSFVARTMFKSALRVLKPSGELWVVGNRHLGYERMLNQVFGSCEQMSTNSKFVVLRAKKAV